MKIKTLFLEYSLDAGEVGKPRDAGLLLGNHRTWQGAGRRLARFIRAGHDRPGYIFAVCLDTGETRARNACKALDTNDPYVSADDIGLSAKERARYRADRIADDLA